MRAELEKLLAFKDDEKVLDRLVEIKHANKEALCKYLEETQGVKVSPDTIFDIQIKRLHEYKRQQLNALYIIDKYLEIKDRKDSGCTGDSYLWSKGSTGLCDRKRYHSFDSLSAGDHQQ